MLVDEYREALEACGQTNPRCCESGENAAAGRDLGTGAAAFATNCKWG